MQQVGQSVQGFAPLSSHRLPQPSSRGAFVVNLGSSSTPVSLSEPRQPELKAFTFFISRRREDGRERFRLHMGYFETQQDAEAMLDAVRDIYPGAWAGIAPGRTAPEHVAVPVTEVSVRAPEPVATATAAPAREERVEKPRATRSAADRVASPPSLPPLSAPTAKSPPSVALPPMQANGDDRAEAGAQRPGYALLELKLELEPATPAPDEHYAATQSLDSVRAAIASLDDSSLVPSLTSTQTLKLLETPQGEEPDLPATTALPDWTPRPTPAASPAARPSAQVLPLKTLAEPERVQSPTARPEAIAAYAVQLRWATQPIGLSELPPLAIFDAYTLYRAKGRQDGTQWHALRLGFFNDLVSAEQVTNYIRSEFAAATVVPVGAAEREKALSASSRPAARAATPAAAAGAADKAAPPADATGQFRLIDDSGVKPVERSTLEMMLTADASAPPAAKPAGGKQAANAGKPVQKTRRPPASLEETLDVLGAGSLKLDKDKGEMLDASGVRRMRHAAERKPEARSGLSKLFERLADRMGGR